MNEAGSAGKLRDAWGRILTLEPLALTPTQVREFAFRGHSMHGTLADLARFIGPANGPEGLRGFGYDDIRELGHWQRDANEPTDAAEAARRATAAGLQAPAPGAAALRGAMPVRYSSGAGRRGERTRQVEVRALMINWMRVALARVRGGWRALLPHVRQTGSDWDVLFPERAGGPTGFRMVPAPAR